MAVVGVLMQPAETVRLDYGTLLMSDVYMWKSSGPNIEPNCRPIPVLFRSDSRTPAHTAYVLAPAASASPSEAVSHGRICGHLT